MSYIRKLFWIYFYLEYGFFYYTSFLVKKYVTFEKPHNIEPDNFSKNNLKYINKK